MRSRSTVVALAAAWIGSIAGCSLLAPSDHEATSGSAAAANAAGTDAHTDTGAPGDGGVVVTDASLDDGGLVSVLRVRCGASPAMPPYTDSRGRVWSSDVGFDTGMSLFNADPIANTADPTLYHTERYADRTASPDGFTYTFPSISKGEYVVTLRFAETSGAPINGPNQRKFNVLINGTQVLTELDIFAEAGKGKALDKTFAVTVQSAPLVLQFKPGTIENPKVNAIEVQAR